MARYAVDLFVVNILIIQRFSLDLLQLFPDQPVIEIEPQANAAKRVEIVDIVLEKPALCLAKDPLPIDRSVVYVLYIALQRVFEDGYHQSPLTFSKPLCATGMKELAWQRGIYFARFAQVFFHFLEKLFFRNGFVQLF